MWFANVMVLLIAIVCGCAAAVGQVDGVADTNGKVIVTVSVDWEGFSLDDGDLRSFERFREQYPSVPLTQFLNAVYYTRHASSEVVTKAIRRVVRKRDEVGVHIHCWRSLVAAAKVDFRSEPRFWSGVDPLWFVADDGYDVVLTAYDADEVEKLARTSREILEEAGFHVSPSFRAGGWMASSSVLHGIRKAGFMVDSSATDRTWHREELEGQPIFDQIGLLWGHIRPDTQPFVIDTPAGKVVEMPDTCALTDYVTSHEMNKHIEAALAVVGDTETRFVHIGFHQEGCSRFLARVDRCVKAWVKNPRVQFKTLREAVEIWRARRRSADGR